MKIKHILIGLLITVSVNSCTEKVPLTGRKQVSLVNEGELVNMSMSEYQKFLSQHPPLPASDPRASMVKNVGVKIQNAVTKFMKDKGLSKNLNGYKWEFNTVDAPEVNAWCMPGGKVVVYTGLLPVTQDEASLAIVMGHEIAHAVARHGNERMSQAMIVQGIGVGVAIAVSQKPEATQNLFLQSYGITSQLGMLKYSRTHESEADKMGLVFSAMAGYDPNVAVSFWQRMAAKGGEQPIELLSTHPSDATRISDIKAILPEAMKYYKKQ
ncbi:MAG: Peptidase family [Bacteroidota bacterium]|jgi:predicted Zn-dependent protease|nr:Peptidase family [Bacteroidota bacterium]